MSEQDDYRFDRPGEQLYEFRKASGGAFIFYEAGKPYQIGGSAGSLLFILKHIPVPAEPSWAPANVEKAIAGDQVWDAELPKNRRRRAYDYFCSADVPSMHPSKGKPVLEKYVEIANRPYFRWPDVRLRSRLSSGNGDSLLFEPALPVRVHYSHLIHDTPGEAFRALTEFLWSADSRIVSQTMLRHFLFDYMESIGRKDFAQQWARNYDPGGLPPPWPGPQDKRDE